MTKINSDAFYNCYNLNKIVTGNGVISIGGSAFSSCYSSSIIIGNSVENIGNYSFRSNNFTSVTIPSSVRKIDYYAFTECKKLANIILLPTTPPILGSSVFTSISSNAVITVPKGSLNAYQTAEN